ncbi:MAG: hypothetical protein ACFE95_21690 [Candidatus Hodarchaeota archaeon]
MTLFYDRCHIRISSQYFNFFFVIITQTKAVVDCKDADWMQITERLSSNKSLDTVLQLIYVSSNLFSSFEFQDELGFLKIHDGGQYSKSELRKLLTYFLDLIEFLTHERVILVQDPENEFCYSFTGLIGGY